MVPPGAGVGTVPAALEVCSNTALPTRVCAATEGGQAQAGAGLGFRWAMEEELKVEVPRSTWLELWIKSSGRGGGGRFTLVT